MNNPGDISGTFSRAANTYEENAWHQRQAADRLCRMIPDDFHPSTILEWGCGTGLLTRLLARRRPDASLTALDIAPGMLAQARELMPQQHIVRWIKADANDFMPEQPVDLLAGNCATQWFSPAAELGARAAAVTAPGGMALFSVPLRGTLAELWRAMATCGEPDDGGIPLARLDDYRRGFSPGQWEEVSASAETMVRTHTSAREALLAIRRIGVTARPGPETSRPMSAAAMRRVMRVYQEQSANQRGVTCTYEIGFLRARRVRGRQTYRRT